MNDDFAVAEQKKKEKKDAIVTVDPVTEYVQVFNAAKAKNLQIIVVQITSMEHNEKIKQFIPTNTKLQEAGAKFIVDLSSTTSSNGDCYECVHALKLIEIENNLRIKCCIPLSETGVNYTDVVSVMLGLNHYNDLSLIVSRRDKGMMKETIRDAGLRTAKFGRIRSIEDIERVRGNLHLNYPIVIKTPQGFSSTDVYICQSLDEAKAGTNSILRSNNNNNGVGPDGRIANHVLLEEYIHGIEFAVNVMVFQGGTDVYVTDVWMYDKTVEARYCSADICNPYDKSLIEIIQYATKIVKSIGIKYGAGHVEVKALYNEENRMYYNPCLIEVGARLSGGQKSSMTQIALASNEKVEVFSPDTSLWDPFSSLIDAHCGLPLLIPSLYTSSPSLLPPFFFTPKKFIRHIFLPIEKSGYVTNIQHDVFEYDFLKSLRSYVILIKEGDYVKQTSDITSCAGFVWLIGNKDRVDSDASRILSDFQVSISQEQR